MELDLPESVQLDSSFICLTPHTDVNLSY